MTKQQTTDKTTDVSRCKFLGAGTAHADSVPCFTTLVHVGTLSDQAPKHGFA